MKLQGNTILLTGGSGGIGFELAARLLQRGNVVIVTGRDQSALESSRQKLPGLHTIRSDVRDPQAIVALHQRVMNDFPAVNVLLNNAGVMRKINLQTFGARLDDIIEEVEINLSGPVRMVMQFLPQLLARDHAAVINVSSGLAFVPYPVAPVYGATKAALHSFTQSLRIQLKYTKIKVFELAPPVVNTALSSRYADELKGTPVMSTSKLVDKAMKGLERDRLEIRPGLANVLKILSRVAPGFILDKFSKPVDLMLAQMKLLDR